MLLLSFIQSTQTTGITSEFPPAKDQPPLLLVHWRCRRRGRRRLGGGHVASVTSGKLVGSSAFSSPVMSSFQLDLGPDGRLPACCLST